MYHMKADITSAEIYTSENEEQINIILPRCVDGLS
jgi:hypothetical protein